MENVLMGRELSACIRDVTSVNPLLRTGTLPKQHRTASEYGLRHAEGFRAVRRLLSRNRKTDRQRRLLQSAGETRTEPVVDLKSSCWLRRETFPEEASARPGRSNAGPGCNCGGGKAPKRLD